MEFDNWGDFFLSGVINEKIHEVKEKYIKQGAPEHLVTVTPLRGRIVITAIFPNRRHRRTQKCVLVIPDCYQVG